MNILVSEVAVAPDGRKMMHLDRDISLRFLASPSPACAAPLRHHNRHVVHHIGARVVDLESAKTDSPNKRFAAIILIPSHVPVPDTVSLYQVSTHLAPAK